MSNPNESEVKILSILLVDDMDYFLEVAKRILVQRLNAKVDLASTGMGAISKLKEKRYDLIITDLFLPDMSGEQLIRQVRSGQIEEIHNVSSIPIVVLSGGFIEPDLLSELKASFASKTNIEYLPDYIEWLLFEGNTDS